MIRQINTTASSDVMRGIETKVILSLYETCVLPCLLNNAESWTLSISEEKKLDTIGIKLVKRLFGLPTTSPNVSVIFTFGLLYITQVIDKKRFIYLHKILTHPETQWTHKVFLELIRLDIGWARNILEKLNEYDLETDLECIKKFTPNEWKNKVHVAVLKRNGEKLMQNCTTSDENGVKISTKTKHIHNILTNCKYSGEPIKCIIGTDKQRARSIFLAQNHMLECGANMKGTISEMCRDCQIRDDESHRMNHCKKYARENDDGIYAFDDIYNDDVEIVNKIVDEIEKVWETRYANGRMKK